MECSRCQRENPADNAFCGGCGAPLARGCPSCGRENPTDHAFCGGCGSPIDATTAAANESIPPAASPQPRSLGGGRYQITRFLGEGSRKRVYLARDTRLGRDVAVAEIKTEGLDENGRARVRREAEALGRLGDHPHIVTIHDVSEERGAIHIVAQYLSGGDLEDHLAAAEGRRLPIDEALRIAGEIGRALEHAHARNIIHRDLKPGNIWLGGDGAASLGDFGLALDVDRSRISTEGSLVGTVAYMPPEQALGRAPDARSDLYALGATLYEMLTGRPPFVGDDAVAVISQHINTPPVAPSWHNPNVHAPLEALVLKLLAKDPHARPASATEVCESLSTLRAAPAGGSVDTAPAAANPLDRLAAGIFVGREREFQTLRHGVDQALSGHGCLLMLVGEPGIGKTRSAEELTTYARMRGAQVLWGRCYEGEGAPAYWPWVQIVRAYAHDREPKELMTDMGPGAADIAEVVSEVRERLPGLPPPPPLEAEEARFRLFDSVTTFLRNASAHTPLVLVLDDLHWADKSSLLLLQFLAREIGGARLLVLGTYRDVDLGRKHPLEETLAALTREHLFERVLLRGLGEADVSRFIAQAAHIEPPAALVEAVYRETEGNPFFVAEVVRLLEADGRLQDAGAVGTWSLDVPQGVRQVVGRRLNALSEACNETLTLASVVGREFGVETLTAASDQAEETILGAIEEAVGARLIDPDESTQGRYRFSHALVEQTLYEELSAPRRVPLHRRIGEALESAHGGKPGPHLAQIARHFFEAVQLDGADRSIAASKRAAEWARGRQAYEEAANHIDRAVQALELQTGVDRRDQCELLTTLAELRLDAGETDAARQAALRVVEFARALPAPDLFARGALAYGGAFGIVEMGRVDETMLRLLEEALALLPEEDSALRVDVMSRFAAELYFSMDLERVRSLHDETIAMAERIGDPALLSDALASSIQSMSIHDFDGRVERAERALALRPRQRGAGQRGPGYLASVAGSVYFWRGDRAEAEARWAQAVREVGRTPAGRYMPILHQAMWATLDGRFDDAEKLAQEANAAGRRAFQRNALIWFGAQMSLLWRLRGETLAPELEGSRQSATRYPDYPAFPAYFVEVAARHGAIDDARAELERLAAFGLDRIPEDLNYFPTLYYLSEAVLSLGDEERAAELRDLVRLHPDIHITMGGPACYYGTTARLLGRLETFLGDPDAAEPHFEGAVAREAAMRARPWQALSQYDYARMLIGRDRTGDAERALGLLNEVLETAQEIGMKGLVEQALADKLTVQGVDTSETQRSIYTVANVVRSQQPDLRPHAAPDGTVTIMFSDMQGFTEMTDRLGDLKAREVVREHNRVVREKLARHGGYEVELQGDGFLLAFGSARRALDCAIDLQRAFDRYSAEHPEQPIRVRIGLHTGEALKDADKFFGRTVILAARIAGEADGGEILVSSILKELTASAGDLRFGAAREAALKGISETQRLYPVGWSHS